MNLGIDASNLSVRGGGATHLRGVLNAARPQDHGFQSVVVFGAQELIDSLPNKNWLRVHHHPWLDRGLVWRTAWQNLRLDAALESNNCDLLFAPCGNYLGGKRPFVAMSHNLLLFEPRERARFGWSWMRCKLSLLSLVQQKCFQKADGLILISHYAKMCIRRSLQRNLHDMPVIYHGVGERFVCPPKPQRSIASYSKAEPFRLLYVSTVSNYKHQDKLVRAFARLCEERMPVHLDLVGGAYRPALRKLKATLAGCSAAADHVTYHGSVPIEEIQSFYKKADAFVFPSSCENMPNILIEAMQSGLPICCSNRGPMPEILGEHGYYFSPDSEEGMAEAMRQLLNSPEERAVLAAKSFEAAKQFTWGRCAQQTFGYFADVCHQSRTNESSSSIAQQQRAA